MAQGEDGLAWLAEAARSCPRAALAHGEAAAALAEARLLRAALRRVQAACGLPDPQDGCRAALAVATEALRP